MAVKDEGFMDKKDAQNLAGRIKALFEEKFGQFRTEDFVAVADELGFGLTSSSRTSPEEKTNYTYHATQQPGEGFWAAAPGAGDISEGMVWVSTEGGKRG
jgi:hypothetical protein